MTRGPLAFQSKFTNNALVIIDALSDSDLQSALRLADDVGAMAAAEGRAGYCRYFKVNSAAELEGLLQEVHAQCQQGLRPILHVESHGDKLAGIEIGAAGEMVPWSTIEAHFRAINKMTMNNLGVVIAACFGLHAITPLKIGKPCPFYFLIGPDKVVAAGDIDEAMPAFYRTMLGTNSLDEAMAKISKEFRQFHCERFFYVTFAKYLKNACLGAGGARRVERLVTSAVDGGAVANRANLRALRNSAKSFVRSQEPAFNRRAAQFLHGRKSVTYEEFLRFVKGEA
jgi:hypothetical protein